jgi:alpha-dioxygenase
MITNWEGLPKALGLGKWAGTAFKLIGKEKAKNDGVPFCLTEEFAAVYRLHPMLPPGLVVGPERKEFIPLEDLVGDEGRNTIRANPERVMDFWDSVLFYPCGNMSPHNYPTALRKVAPTEDNGKGLPDTEKIDLAAIDLYRDRERGIPRFNDFRRAIRLKPFKTWEALTGEPKGESPNAEELEAIYGAAPDGIEKCDLLVGDLYENKIKNFAISETSFIIFLVMASRRLDADPFLNELYNERSYTKAGLDWIENNNGFKDLLARHYPALADKIPEGQSAFKPYGTKDGASKVAWKKAAEDNVIDSKIQSVWADVTKKNKEFNKTVATEAKLRTKSKSTTTTRST